MLYDHGYEGYIEFEIDPSLRDELVIRTTRMIDNRDGNEFYFRENRVHFLYPTEYYRKKQEKNNKDENKTTVYGFAGSPHLREPIYDLFLWLRENGNIKKAEITPYDKLMGVRKTPIFVLNNQFYKEISIEPKEDPNKISEGQTEATSSR